MTVPLAQRCCRQECDAEAVDPLRNGALCEDHLNGGEGDRDHDNPIDASDVTDAERAAMLREYLEAFVAEFGDVPRLMPLDDEGKAPIIQGRCPLDSPEGRSFLVDGEEAIRQIREEGARGFAIYAGKPDHRTEDAVFVDDDDPENFPREAFPPTLQVLTGSGRGTHDTYRNAGDVENAKGKDGVDGEIRAENWYCVVPGSIHPSGGVYHVTETRDVVTLASDDVPPELQPGSRRRDCERTAPDVEDLDGEGETPDKDGTQERLEAAFENSHDGDRIKKVYNGRYRAAGFDDRSSAEFWLANRLDSWVGLGNERRVERLMDRANLQKWPERPDRSYRESVLANVGYQDWYYTDDEDEDAGEREPVAPIALARLEQLDGRQRERFLESLPDGALAPTTDEARDRLRDGLFRELRAGNTTVLDAPTALGKSYTVATEPWTNHADITGEKPVIQLHATRDARDEALKATRDSSARGALLKGRTECSPIARGDHDPDPDAPPDQQSDPVVTIDGQPASEWFDVTCDEKGLPFSTALAIARERNDQGLEELPPVGREDPAVEQWDGIPWTEDGDPAVDVVHATHQLAHVPSLRQYTNVILDEQPDYSQQFTDAGNPETETGRIRSMVTAYLQEIGAPVTTWEAFVTLAQHTGGRSDAAAERDALDNRLGREPPREWYVEEPAAHALAPDLTRAIWQALRWEDPDANGLRNAKVFHEPPRLDAGDGDQFAGTWLSVVINESNTIQSVRATPDFSQARAVVGLDAHPCMPMWELNAGPDMTPDAILEGDERRLWRRYVRGLTVVQVGDATRPRSGENAREWMNDDRVRTVIERLRDYYGSDFRTAIAPIQVENAVGQLLEDVTGADAETKTMHYGEEKSRNDFADEPAGYLYGCMDPGDRMILNALAELGLDAEAPRVDPDDVTDDEHAAHRRCGGAGCPECNHTGRKREKGRAFTGPDAETAAALLASVRENHVAQGAGRYARNADNPDDSAIVFAHTNATPTGFADLEVPGVEWLASDLQRAIIDELVTRPAATTREIADALDCTKEHVRQTLTRLEEKGLVERDRGTGDHGADVYQGDDATNAFVDLGETANDPLQGYSRASLATRDRHVDATGDTGDGAVGEGVATDGGRPNGGEPPPDDDS